MSISTERGVATPVQELLPWHEGELQLQRSIGAVERMAAVGRQSILPYLLDQHREFYPQLPFVVLGAVDPEGDVWATLRAGRPGFLHAPDSHQLDVDLGRDGSDPADRGMEDGDAIGLLGIELHTRRRNRLNGPVRRQGPAGFSIGVEQSFGNCPQYIQVREFRFMRAAEAISPIAPVTLDRLEGEAAAWVRRADTLFVASYAEAEDGHRQVDVSHRGGRPGFVRLDDDGALTIPDFAGNHFFATLGNFLVNRKAGLVFVDFESGDLLQITGSVEVILDSPEIEAFQGAERLWRIRPSRIVLRREALPLRWAFANQWSPTTLLTGDWDGAAERLQAIELATKWRQFRVAAIKQESSLVRSFILDPTDGAGIIPHKAGQYLPIRVTLPGETQPVLRTYTISAAPSEGRYRISVKRDGAVSQYLHTLDPGALIDVRGPDGDFTIDAGARRPAVLIAAGIGITPIRAMLRHLIYEGARTRGIRPTFVIYAARSKAERALNDEVVRLAAQTQGAVRLVRYLSDTTDAEAGDYERAGRLSVTDLSSMLPFDDYDFYLCGPAGFMQSLYDGLRDHNIADDRIHAEAFGPGGMRRRVDQGNVAIAANAPATHAVSVRFTRSGRSATWTPGSGSLLELAEANGLAPPYSCREGSCGTCRTRLEHGAVSYTQPPSAAIPEGQALICCSVPAETDEGGISLAL
jgi:uncharacterized protein